jgi:hypothetical protein
MKDIFGNSIKVGDNIAFIQSAASRTYEKAIVAEITDNHLKIEYLGIRSCCSKSWNSKKKIGDKSKLTATESKVIILNSGYDASSYSLGRDIYQEEKDRLQIEIELIKTKLGASVKENKKLMEKNRLLLAEVDKIHSRFDILDL